ncbi:hypothetical protein D8674_011473 [Pyrus ussuriensis x Pyrus communis]|uniref:Uncharacterized protein n=1 Tax=Pyrus ussuriensis x Pyrus communis TaxID=2448454 RepID=A0A5N5FYT3_9ROSA|nr:hypothetical protein D8674_011473 [Pyrus ussuriensis x Pyrus communis]
MSNHSQKIEMGAPTDTAETTDLSSTLLDSIHSSIDEPTAENFVFDDIPCQVSR